MGVEVVQSQILWVVIALVGALAIVQTLRLHRQKRVRHLSHRRRALRAVEGEREALALLKAAGYRRVDSQVRVPFEFLLDGECHSVELRADHIVSRNGQRFVAEVKTGAIAPSARHGPTRRQLIEYAIAFDVDGVLLVDADRQRIQAFSLPNQIRRSTSSDRLAWAGWWLTMTVLAALLYFMLSP